MSQSTFDDDELFGEAAEEIRADVEESLGKAREALPAVDDVWETEAKNTLGVINGLRSAVDVEDVEAHLRDAKKWFAMGTRADAFESAEDLEADIEAIEDVLADFETVRDQAGELASTLPKLKGELEDAHAED
jgi:hypothetical protein